MAGKAAGKPKRGRGKPPAITPAMVKLLIKAIGHGTPKAGACRLARISFNSYRNWMNRGELAWEAAGESDAKVKIADRQYVDLFLGVSAAIAKTIDDALANIGRAGKKNWQASSWLVSRLCPERYADNRADLIAMRRQLKQLLKEIDQQRAVMAAQPTPGDEGGRAIGSDPIPLPVAPEPATVVENTPDPAPDAAK